MLHQEALAILKQRLTPLVSIEQITLGQALGRVVAENITAPHDVPTHTNSAVDGYAFCHKDLGTTPLSLSGRIAAGDLEPLPLPLKTAVRIFTGATMPQGADTIAMQEDCQIINDEQVQLPQGLGQGANCRSKGEDLKSGDLVIAKGRRLTPTDIAALASIGIAKLPVYQRLKVVLFSNGNEMRVPGASPIPLQSGEVYDANQPLLSALCQNLPLDLHLGGIIKDDANTAYTTIKNAAQEFDVIITTGGASRGSEDHMLPVLDKLGKRHLWQLAVKPGRPMMFGQIPKNTGTNDCLFFGLPGNPVAAMVCFLLYTRPTLLSLGGANWQTPPRFQIPAAFSIMNKKPDRREFLRGILDTDNTGALTVKKYQRDGSGLISSLREADGLIEIEEQITSLKQGELVSFIPFSSFD